MLKSSSEWVINDVISEAFEMKLGDEIDLRQNEQLIVKRISEISLGFSVASFVIALSL